MRRSRGSPLRLLPVLTGLGLACILATGAAVRASTYVVYIALDSPIYEELDTLQGFGMLDSYLAEVKPISRVEAARLTLEAERNLVTSEDGQPLAEEMVQTLRSQLSEEIEWLEQDAEDGLPTMLHPLERIEAQYVFSRGQRRQMINNGAANGGALIQATEATPLLPNNDDLPTAPGSNEIARWSGWGGAGGFLSAYAEGALAGPLTREPSGTSRARLVRGELVVGLGNVALSAGEQEMAWGTGHFASLSQGDNARPFKALRLQNIHPGHLPGFLRYLGPFRGQAFFGQLDHGRVFANPWISGEILAFKPLPTFEWGITHTIMFGGRFNDHYGPAGFFGRLTGLSTGNPSGANTNSRGGLYLKFYLPSLRNAQVYQEILGEDNLTAEVRPIGRFLPFLAVSYQGGFYLPRLTADGLTTARFEYAILEPNYSTHSDSLYWTYDDRLMGDPLGPNASQIDVAVGRWLTRHTKLDLDAFYTERAPKFGVTGLHKERSVGFALDLLELPVAMPRLGGSLGEVRARTAVEYVHGTNFLPNNNSLRVGVLLSFALTPALRSLIWR